MKALNEDLKRLTDKFKDLKSSIPTPIEEQLEQISSKITQLDNAVTDHSDLLKKVDPNGLIEDTEYWISEMYDNANNGEQNKWSRLESAEVLDRFNRMDQATVDGISDIYLNEGDERGSGHKSSGASECCGHGSQQCGQRQDVRRSKRSLQ